MHGLVSLLDEVHYKKVETIWNEFEEKFDLSGIKITPFPHFSWQLAEEYDLEKLEVLLKNIATETKPFKINTSGLGLFTGDYPVLFISLVKTKRLIDLHNKIWSLFKPFSTGISNNYHPKYWVPHISIAYSDLTYENIGDVMRYISFKSLNWEIIVDNFAFIYEPKGSIGDLRFKFNFNS